jgi:hypothetical protein
VTNVGTPSTPLTSRWLTSVSSGASCHRRAGEDQTGPSAHISVQVVPTEAGISDPATAERPAAVDPTEHGGALADAELGPIGVREGQMVRASLIAIGTIAAVVGYLLTGTGLNVISATRMSGDITWAIVGPIVAVVGMLLLLFGVRRSEDD